MPLTLAHFGRGALGVGSSEPSDSGGARGGRSGSSRSWLSLRMAAAFRLASLLGAGSPSRRAPSSGASSGDRSLLAPPSSPGRGRFLEGQPPVTRSRMRWGSPPRPRRAPARLPVSSRSSSRLLRASALSEASRRLRGWGGPASSPGAGLGGLGRAGGNSSASSALRGPAMVSSRVSSTLQALGLSGTPWRFRSG